jgi:hypothetical protein
MDETRRVGGVERFADLFGNAQNFFVREVLFGNFVSQSFSFDYSVAINARPCALPIS